MRNLWRGWQLLAYWKTGAQSWGWALAATQRGREGSEVGFWGWISPSQGPGHSTKNHLESWPGLGPLCWKEAWSRKGNATLQQGNFSNWFTRQMKKVPALSFLTDILVFCHKIPYTTDEEWNITVKRWQRYNMPLARVKHGSKGY